jgi:hypothetical protein
MSLAGIGSLVGGALILAAFIALQLGRVDAEDRRYLALNTGGAIVLVASALLAQLWGFVVLNVVWASASAWGLLRGRVHGEDLPIRSMSSSPRK